VPAQKIIYLVAGLLLGAAAGFFFANTANRRELESLRAEVARARAGAAAEGATDAGRASPADAESAALVARADASPADAALQRQAGERVYRQALTSGEPHLLDEAARLLKRAHEADPKNQDTLLLLGNAHLSLGLARDPRSFYEARGYYVRALREKPGDVNLHTLLGITYFHARPPEPEKAIDEYRKALAADPRHEMALQKLAEALVATGARQEAERRIGELEKLNPANESISQLREKLAGADGGANRP
jgi:tetratricopeptide (TPR) repeat protein